MVAYSKIVLLVGLLFAIVLILSPQVPARELVEAALTKGSVEDNKHGHYPGHGEHTHDHHHHHHHHHHEHHDHHHHHHHGHHGEPGHDDAGEN